MSAAKRCAAEGDRLAAVLIGENVRSLAEEIGRFGADTVYLVEHPALQHYHGEAFFTALKQVVEQAKPDAIFFGHTAIGRDLAPKLAAHLETGQLSDIIQVERENGEVVFTRPIYAGKAFEKKVLKAHPWVVTVRPNNIPAGPPQADGKTEVIEIAYTPPSLRTLVKEIVRKTTGKVDLSEAKIVVSGGRGVKGPEGFQLLEALASVLGGAVGASRGACDAGYCDYALQIGQTGKVVTPELYIACGISGAIQHLAGMSQSKVIVAINKDPDAPIFKVADYGIVGDLFEIVPLLTEEFKKALQSV
ncbi:electron transfer flavoprotein subunit alpha [Bacillaceae bacterium]